MQSASFMIQVGYSRFQYYSLVGVASFESSIGILYCTRTVVCMRISSMWIATHWCGETRVLTA